MIWLFERGKDVVRVETRVDKGSSEYVITTTWADGRTETESFPDHAQFTARVQALERQLSADHWTPVGSPTILADGWRGPTAH